MRVAVRIIALGVGLSLSISQVYAQDVTASSILISASDFAPCTLDCVGREKFESTCTNSSCACKLNQAFDEAASCLRTTCSYADILAAKNITSTACSGPSHRNRQGEYLAINLALGIITAVVTIARLVFKHHFSARRRYSADDWVVLSAIAVGLPCAIVNRQGLVNNGLGRDAWTLSLDQISDFAMYFYILEILYLTAISLVKMTLLVFYLTIFPSVSTGTWTRRLLWSSMGFNIVLATVCVFLAIFQCNPVSYIWEQYLDTEISGSCIASSPVAWVNASLNVALDVWMIIIPLKEVWNLRLHWKKKVGVIFMFLMGTFVTVVSILRLLSLSKFDDSINITWDYYGVALWSTIEINVGIICTSLPTLRLILVRISPKAFGSQSSRMRSKSGQTSSTGSQLSPLRTRRFSSVPTCVEDDEELELPSPTRPKLFNIGTQGSLDLPHIP